VYLLEGGTWKLHLRFTTAKLAITDPRAAIKELVR
jgi:hypothetical protein